MGQGIVRGRLRARLLVGVAAAAIAAPATNRALAQDAAKWSPYIELGGMGGNTHSFGDVDIFIPVWQDQTSLLFGDLRGTFSTEPTQEGNFGLGYRTQLNTDWILGGYGYFDIQNSKNDNLYYQITLGAELLSVDWDFRLNGYIPINPDGGIVDSKSKANIQISGNTIQLNSSTQKEQALYGFDGEVGWRVPVFPVDGDIDVRVFAGGYFFTGSDVDTIAGPRGRIEARLYDIDFLGLQSRLTAQGVVQWDQPRGTQGFGGLELRIPLGAVTGNPGPKLNPLDRRMVDRVQRDVDIVTELGNKKKQTEDVIVDELTVSTHTIVFANGTGGGSGAQGSPMDLNGAPSQGHNLGSNAIILADGGAGTIGVSNPLQLSEGQALIGGGSTVRLTGAQTGLHVNFSFPGSRPTLVGNNSTSNLIQMAPGSQNEVFGLNLAGSFSNGVFGRDMYRAIIKHTAISSAAGNGILLVDDPAPSEYVHIAYNTISNAAENGIQIDTIFGGLKTLDVASAAVTAGGADFSQTIRINDNTVTSAGRHGIVLYNTGTGGSLSQSFAILGNTIDHVGGDGILVATSLDGDGIAPVFLAQSGTVAGNQITNVSAVVFPTISGGVRGAGAIAINNEIGGVTYGASLSQALTIVQNTIASAAANGVALTNYLFPGATVAQSFAIDANSIDQVGSNGIVVLNEVDPPSPTAPASLAQSGAIAGNQISNAGEDGIQVANYVTGAGASFGQALAINDNTITSAGRNGIEVSSTVFNALGANQALQIDGNVITDVGLNGIFVDAEVGGFPSPEGSVAAFTQTFAIDNNVISHAGENGILETLRFFDEGGGSVVVAQAGEINGNQVTSTGVNGIAAFTTGNSNSAPGTSLSQTLNINDNSIADVNQRSVLISNAGINVATHLSGVLHATQTIAIDPNTISNVTSGNGISVYTSLTNSTLTQSVDIAANTISGIDSFGIVVHNVVNDFGGDGVPTSLSQFFNITGNDVTGGSFGIAVLNRLTTGKEAGTAGPASLAQTGLFGGNVVDGASSVGIKLATYASHSGASFSQNVSAISNSVADTGSFGLQTLAIPDSTIVPGVGSGIAFYAKLDYGARGTQNLLIAGNSVANSGSNGILVSNRVVATSSNSDVATQLTQTAAITGNQVTNSGSFGIHVDNYVSASEFVDPHATATLVQDLTIAGNSVTGSGFDGVLVANGVFAHGEYGSAFLLQTASIFGNNISDSGENGILVSSYVKAVHSGAATLSQSVAIDDNTVVGSGYNGILVATYVRAVRYGSATLSQSLAINDNTVSGSGADGIRVTTVASGYYGFNLRSGFVSFTQTVTVDPNTVIDSGGDGIAVVTHIRDVDLASQTINIADNMVVGSTLNGIFVRTDVFADGEGGNTFLSQLAAIDGNRISDSGENGILVDNSVEARYFVTATLSQHLVINDNTIADSVSNGIFVSNFASGYNLLGPEGHVNITQTGAILGNQIANSVISSGLNGIFLSNYVGGAGGKFATIGQSLTIAFNTIDGVGSANVTNATGSTPISRDGGNGIVVRNVVGGYATLNQSLGISSNVATNVRSFDGVYIKTTAYRGGTANQSFTITGNQAFDNGGYGVAIKAIVKGDTVSAPGGTINETLAITGNNLDKNLYGALGVFALASRGTIVQTGTIANNVLTNATAEFGEGIDAVALAGSQGTVTQTIAVNNNTIGGNAVGVYLAAGDRVVAGDFQTLTGGIASQTWNFTGNSITGNNANFVSSTPTSTGHGLYAVVSGSNATQLITLVSGNLISGNSGDGVRLVDLGAQQTATLNSNLGGGPVLNTITANGANLYFSSAGGTQVVHK